MTRKCIAHGPQLAILMQFPDLCAPCVEMSEYKGQTIWHIPGFHVTASKDLSYLFVWKIVD